jgi:biopolymer transport protein ExbB
MNPEYLQIFVAGGWVMAALAIISLFLYKTILGLLMFVRGVQFDELRGENLQRLAEARTQTVRTRKKTPADLQIEVVEELLRRFQQLVGARLKYSKALVIAAPLLGLLGTVQGMLVTFHGLSLEQRHEITRTMADGIWQALVATEAGLIVAIPALFLLNWIRRESQRHELRLLETKLQLLAQTKA